MKGDKNCGDDTKAGEQKDVILTPILQESLDNIAKKEGYITYEITKKMVSTGGGNFLADLYEVDINGKTLECNKETNIFVKKVLSEDWKGYISMAEAYSTELYAYTDLFKIFEKLQDEAKIPEDDKYKMVMGYEESNSEAIILENMAKRGFKTGYRMDVMSLKFAELSLKQLAKFHALSWVLEKKNPLYFDKKVKPLKYLYDFSATWRKICEGIMTTTINNIEDSEIRERAKEFMPIALDKYPRYFNPEYTSIRCLCHGDYRLNNILMKEIDGDVAEVIPVDLQALNYGCPLNDFFYFIFLNTDQKFRKANLSNLKELYYNTLTKFLTYFDMDLDQIFSRKEYDTLFKERMDYGLIISLSISGFIFMTENDAADIEGVDIQEWKPKFDVVFQERFRETLEDCTSCDYL